MRGVTSACSTEVSERALSKRSEPFTTRDGVATSTTSTQLQLDKVQQQQLVSGVAGPLRSQTSIRATTKLTLFHSFVQLASLGAGENMAPKPPDGIETDFGKVMANFLYCEDKCFKKHGGRVWRGELPNTQSVNDFLTSHVKDGIASVEDFSQKYNWHEAKCRLIATAPGDHAGQISKSNKFVYGSQAVANALATCGEQNKWRKVQSKVSERSERAFRKTRNIYEPLRN